MLIWRGWGILVVPIVLLAGIAAIAVQDLVLPRSQLATLACMAGGLALAAWLVWWSGRKLNGAPVRNLVDVQTGERIRLRPRHDLFFIRMEYWAVPLLLMAALILVLGVYAAINPPG
ncbi:hypothetical protein [Pseudoroseomonas cervicalis]|uniref:hypothetical protein n=1 Tax=Teichococcus cervicalis TaxID=204525 RepID=UPI0022F14B1C|nr:hypothetical protein [Pseudoroseomonas cervicalis]WBV42209.1 hypothetical protein PFY06_13330 [Pseudoroseomonas cervicalis]